MKRSNRKFGLTLAAALLGAFAAVATAQMYPRGPAPVSAYDANGDGWITSQEFYDFRNARIADRAKEGRMMRNFSSAPSFESLDADGDGRLSGMELERGQALHMQQRPNRGAAGAPGYGPGRGGPAGSGGMGFADFDQNGDGVITEDEFQSARTNCQAAGGRPGMPMMNR